MIPVGEAVEAAGQFLSSYVARSGANREQLLDRRVVSTCTCDYEECEGFQLIPEYCVLEWRGEVILIRGDAG